MCYFTSNENEDEEQNWYDCGDDPSGNWYGDSEECSIWYECVTDLLEDDSSYLVEDKKDVGGMPIYQGASITVVKSAILILSFALQHNLTRVFGRLIDTDFNALSSYKSNS